MNGALTKGLYQLDSFFSKSHAPGASTSPSTMSTATLPTSTCITQSTCGSNKCNSSTSTISNIASTRLCPNITEFLFGIKKLGHPNTNILAKLIKTTITRKTLMHDKF